MSKAESEMTCGNNGCVNVIEAFVAYLIEREKENFRSRRSENRDSVTLTTIHQVTSLMVSVYSLSPIYSRSMCSDI